MAVKVKEPADSWNILLSQLLIGASLIATLLLASCNERGNETPAGGESAGRILDEVTFEQLYIALLESAEAYRAIPDTIQKKFDPAPTFARFNVKEADFRATVASYRKDVRKWQAFYTRVIGQLEEKEKNQTEKKDTARVTPVEPF